MAIIKRKFVNDLNKNRAIGIAFPLSHDTGGFRQTYTQSEAVKNNILNVLLTEKGERVNQPDLGVGLKSLLFENITDASTLIPIIEDQLDKYVPDAIVQDINSEFDPDSHILKITLVYILALTGDADSIEVNVGGQGQSFDYKDSEGGYVTGTEHVPHIKLNKLSSY